MTNDTTLTTNPLPKEEDHSHHHKKNLYPAVRHILLIIFVLCTLTFIFFLVHQNGKSIYDNGL